MQTDFLGNLGIDAGYLIVLLFMIQILLFILLISVNMKYNRLKRSYSTFMKGKDGKNLPCSQEKLQYLENGIARVAAGRVKILLSLPAGKEVKHALVQFEDELLRDYPEIYHANRNKAVKLLRVSRYGLYRAAVWALGRSRRKF